MNVITRDCINPNIVLHRTDNNFNVIQSMNYEEFCGSIDFWKMFLVERYDARAGERAFIWGHPGYHYYGLVFAALELGIVLILDWPHCYTEEDIDSYKVGMFGKIDYIINTDFGYANKKDEPEFYKWDHIRNQRFGRNLITMEEFVKYTIQDGTRYKEISERIACTPNSPMLIYSSSGTTGLPKHITNTHLTVYTMSQRMAHHFDYRADEKILHTNNMHHGITMCLHFLPSFMTSNIHYTENPARIKTGLVNFVNREKINRLYLYIPQLVSDWLHTTPTVNHPVKITTLYQITPEFVRLMKEKNIAAIESSFGDTNIGAGFFIKRVTQNTDIATYNVTNFGKPLDNFYQFDIRDGMLYIKCPELGIDWVTSTDSFELIDDEYYFKGRANVYRIGEEWFKLVDVESAVKQTFGADATIVVDIDMQKIYLAIWKDNPVAEAALHKYFKDTYQLLSISYIMRGESSEKFFNSRKIDNSKIRDYCRNRIGLK